MGRSPGFASTTCDYCALFRLAFATATHLKCLTLPQTVTRRLIMRKARSHPLQTRRFVIGLLQLVSVWFQVLLTPLIGVLFIVSSRYFSLSVVEEYLALEGGPPSFTRSSTGSVLLWYIDNNGGLRFCVQDFHLLWLNFPEHSADAHFVTPYRCPQPQRASSLVWAFPVSLAATNGVSFDFLSCRY
jgi:hypothetical protein